MSQWIWQHTSFPEFFWQDGAISALLAQARFIQGKLLGTVQTLFEVVACKRA